MADAYVEQEQCSFGEISMFSNPPEMTPLIAEEYNRIQKEELVEGNPRNEMTLRNIVAKTFYFEYDEYGARVPIMNSDADKIAVAKSYINAGGSATPYGGY